MLSPQELATIAAIIPTAVGFVALNLPAANRARVLRPLSAILGIVLAVGTFLVSPGAHSAADILTVAEVGFGLGSGVTIAVAGVKAAPAAVKRIPVPSVSLKRSPAAPVVEAPAPTAS